MGHPLILQALPADSGVYALLGSDPGVGTVFARLFNAGGGPYSWAGMADLHGHLGDIAADGSVFASRSEADRALAELLAGLAEARAGHPGLEGRRAFLGKTQWDIKERLAWELHRRGRADADEFARAVVFGAGPLTPAGVTGPLGDGLRVVPPGMVREAARVLRDVPWEGLFDPEDEGAGEDYRALRALYAAAADYGEAVVVGD